MLSVGISKHTCNKRVEQVLVFSEQFLEYYIELSGYNISSHAASSFQDCIMSHLPTIYYITN